MTLYDKLFEIATTSHNVLPESWKEKLRPYIVEEMDKIAKEVNYDGWTYDRPVNEYPATIQFFFQEPVRKAVLKFLQENHPQAWFLPMYLSVEEQRAIGLPV